MLNACIINCYAGLGWDLVKIKVVNQVKSEELLPGALKLLQSEAGYRYSIDPFLVASFVSLLAGLPERCGSFLLRNTSYKFYGESPGRSILYGSALTWHTTVNEWVYGLMLLKSWSFMFYRVLVPLDLAVEYTYSVPSTLFDPWVQEFVPGSS
jgi:hypothetical protein